MTVHKFQVSKLTSQKYYFFDFPNVSIRLSSTFGTRTFTKCPISMRLQNRGQDFRVEMAKKDKLVQKSVTFCSHIIT